MGETSGAWIVWKHVGHSIFEPLCDMAHLMCCPHTGQEYVNSLIAGAICVLLGYSIPFSEPDCNPEFSFVAAPCDRHSNFIGQMILQRSWTAAANSFESDFWHRQAQLGWSSGFSLSANKLKFELQQNEKEFSSLPQRTIRRWPGGGRDPIHRIRFL
jgi:hypothetical protein